MKKIKALFLVILGLTVGGSIWTMNYKRHTASELNNAMLPDLRLEQLTTGEIDPVCTGAHWIP